MPDQKNHKLSAKDRIRLCGLLAVGYNPERCKDIFLDEYALDISPQNIRKNYLNSKKWQKIILRLQTRADGKILQHALAHKVNRLKILKDAINEAFTWRLDKIHYDKDGNELSRVEKRNIGMIANLIREARTEVEGDKPLIDQSTHFHLTKLNDKSLIEQCRKEDIRIPPGIESRIRETSEQQPA